MSNLARHPATHNDPHWEARVDLAAAFRWTVKLNWHEAVSNHYSLAVNEDGSQFLMNPDRKHFARVKASDMLLLDANDPETMDRPGAPDPTAWGLHGALHRNVPHARCALHVHSPYATTLASLADSSMPPIDQNTAMFFNRIVVDEDYGGLAFEEEGERVCGLFADPRAKVMVMGNHGLMVIGGSVAEAFTSLYFFERACQTLILAYSTGKPLRTLSDEIAEGVASGVETYEGDTPHLHFSELKAILNEEGSDYAT